MSGIAQEKPATYADIEALPDNVVGELIDGELFVSPRPAVLHTLAASAIGFDLGPPFHHGSPGPAGWWIFHEPEVHFGTNVLVPDLGGWRRERLTTLPDHPRITVIPDWICEVISPSSLRIDRIKKMTLYAREGVGHAWLVDPIARTLEAFRLENGRWSLLGTHADKERVRIPPFEAVEISLARWWVEEQK